jgi:hypothetical protein
MELPTVDTRDITVQLAAAKWEAHFRYDGTVIGEAVRTEVEKALDKYAESLHSKAKRQSEVSDEARKRQKQAIQTRDQENQEAEAKVEVQERDAEQKKSQEEQVIIWWQNNLTFGGGCQTHTGSIVPWSDVKATVFGQEFGTKKVCFSAFDLSGGRWRRSRNEAKR